MSPFWVCIYSLYQFSFYFMKSESQFTIYICDVKMPIYSFPYIIIWDSHTHQFRNEIKKHAPDCILKRRRWTSCRTSHRDVFYIYLNVVAFLLYMFLKKRYKQLRVNNIWFWRRYVPANINKILVEERYISNIICMLIESQMI